MSLFYVFQGSTYEKELNGEYVWSPQLTKNGRKNAGFTNMTKIKKGDFILHNCNGEILAISIAKSDCYEEDQPRELAEGETMNKWQKEGYKVDLKYYPFDSPLKTADYREWLKKHYDEESAFNKEGRGKQQYLCMLAESHTVFLLEKIIARQTNSDVLFHLEGALNEIVGDKFSEYNTTELDIIDISVEYSDIPIVSQEITVAEKQATYESKSTGRDIPKRNTNVALTALQLADFKCEYNQKDRTFKRKNGIPYTEPHHLIPISKFREYEYSLDVKENIVSLCSHCHNLLHYGQFDDKKVILEKLFQQRVEKLKMYGISITLEKLESYYK